MNRATRVACTTARLACDAQRAWEKVCFYEHISLQPSWLLRTVLPVPVRSTGAHGQVGDVSRCLYSDGGYLTKRITRVLPGERIEFDVIEQSIRYCEDVALKGGVIEVESNRDGTCKVRMLTRYEPRTAAFDMGHHFVNRVVSAMHRIVIRDMRSRLEPKAVARTGSPGESCA